ncbi:MAG: CRTAC1 family protein [Thiohalocapsa sp.]|nr:CRTAC1 family protein [Thiohalocapsa sp.]
MMRWILIASLSCSALGQSALGAIRFADISGTAGPFPTTESWGATAADMNSDGWIDIFYNAHRQRPYIFRNDGNGQFTDVTLRVDRSSTWVKFAGDQHAGSWVDFDNDGDKDLIVATGVNVDAQFFVNEGGYFTDQAIAYGADSFTAAGRAAFWADFSGDGYADLITTTFNPANVYRQDPLVALNRVNGPTGFSCGPRNNHVHLNDFSVDGKADLLCMREAALDILWDISDYAVTGGPFVDITAAMPASALIADSAAADFDNNGETDLLILRGSLRLNEAVLGSADRIEVRVDGGESTVVGPDAGFDFEGGDEINVSIYSMQYTRWRTFIGAAGVRPAEEGPFVLNSSDPAVHGLSPFDPTFGRSIHIGYDTTLSQWQVRVYYGTEGGRAYFMIDRLAGADFANLVFSGLTNGDQAQTPHLFINNAGTFTNEPWGRGLGDAVYCASAGVGDFDNDMDVDIYMVCRGGAQNLPNRLYENDGSGNFTLVAGAGGAEGPLGTAVADGAGIGDSVVVADFDADGFLDLFTVNGLNLQPSREGGPAELYRNLGNANSWIQLDLDGVVSNRDGLGAKVYVTTPDAKIQLREQDGGYHRWSQNAQRLHFGLGSNTMISTLRVEWPGVGGVVNVNEFYNINVGSGGIYRITEGTAGIGSGLLTRTTPGAAAGDVPPGPGDECGETDPDNPSLIQEPWYHPDFGPAMLVWKDCGTGAWHLRTKGGHSPKTVSFRGRLTSTRPFTRIAGYDIDSFDSFEVVSPNEAVFTLNVRGVHEDGIDFEAPAGSQCLELDAPAEMPILVGAGRWAATSPLSLQMTQQRPSASLFNISTRARVRGGDATMIGGFVVRGDRPKRVLIRARGPSLAASGVAGAMDDPTLRLFSGAAQIDFNDNWRDSDRASEISATGRAPQSNAEAAIIATLPPGAYTAHVTDAAGAAGIAIVEALGIDEEADARLFNVSTRASVETGDGVTIGGFVIRGSGSKRVLVRGRGPSLAASGLTGTLRDPTLEVFSGSTSVAFNDDWRSHARAGEVGNTGRAPQDNREAALLLDLGPGAYTAVLRGDGGASGIGIIEVIAVDEDACR